MNGVCARPLLQFFERLAEVVQDGAVDGIDRSIRRQARNEGANPVEDLGKSELVLRGMDIDVSYGRGSVADEPDRFGGWHGRRPLKAIDQSDRRDHQDHKPRRREALVCLPNVTAQRYPGQSAEISKCGRQPALANSLRNAGATRVPSTSMACISFA